MVGVNQVTGVLAGAVATGRLQADLTTPFSGMLRAMAEQTTKLQDTAHDAVSGLLSGQGVEVHDAMIATQKADLAFELAMQIRNKAVGAYQQMMQMQF